MTMTQGSCKCQTVRFVYSGEFGVITVCHCADCRKLQGSTGVVAAPADRGQLRWIAGQDRITEYESSPGKKRAFCGCCGTPLYSRRDDAPEVLRLRMGSLDTPKDVTPVAHIFCKGIPAWAALDDECPRYERHEPGRDLASAGKNADQLCRPRWLVQCGPRRG